MDIINILDASEKAIATLMLEVNRLNNEIKLKDEQLEALKKELTLQKLSDIGQEIEDRDSAIYATGYWKGIEYKKMRDLTEDTECQYCKQGCFRCDARKTLTDEEIEEVAKPYCDLQNWVVDKHEFARAILKKASEK